MQENPQLPPPDVITGEQNPELIFGAPLDKDQIHALLDYAKGHLEVNEWSPRDKKDAYAAVMAHQADAYDPVVGRAVLDALSSTYEIIEGIDLQDTNERSVAADNEVIFQRTMAVGLLNNDSKALKHPELFSILAGSEKFESALDRRLEASPGSLLFHAEKLAEVLPPDRLKDYLSADLESVSARSDQALHYWDISPQLVDSVGIKRVREAVDTAVEAGQMLVPNEIYKSEIDKLVSCGVIDATQGFEVALQNFANGYISADDLKQLGAESADPIAQQRVHAAYLDVLQNKDSTLLKIEGIIRESAFSWQAGYDPVFAKQILDTARSVHGDAVLLDGMHGIKDVLSEKEIKDVYKAAVSNLDSEQFQDETLRKNLLIDLSSQVAHLGPDDLIKAVDAAIKIDPDFFLQQFVQSRQFGPELPLHTSEYIQKATSDILPELTVDKLLENIEALSGAFPGSEALVRELIISNISTASSPFLLSKDAVRRFLGVDQFTELSRSVVINALSGDDELFLETSLSLVRKNLGIEATRQLVSELMSDNPSLAVALLRESSILLDDEEIGSMADIVIEAGMADKVVSRIDLLVYRLPHETLRKLTKIQIEQRPADVGYVLSSLIKVLPLEDVQRLADEWKAVNPAAVLRDWKNIPEGLFSDKGEIVEYIQQDSRSDLLPKYFRRVAKRLVAAEESTSFAIMAREATATYRKLGQLQDKPGAMEMFEMLRDQMPQKSERSELDALNLSVLLAEHGVDPAEADTIGAAKQLLAEVLNTKFASAGLRLDTSPEGIKGLESHIGNLLPVSMYMLSMPEEKSHVTDYMAIILNNAHKGQLKEWKYGDREYLVNQEVLPELSDDQYQLWQQNNSVTSAEIGAGTAADVASHIQRVMRQNAGFIKGLEKLAEVEGPDELIRGARGDIQEVGQQIAQVHKARGRGELDVHQAAEELAGLQHKKDELQYMLDVVKLTHITPEEVAAGTIFSDNGKPTNTTVDSVLEEVVSRNGEAGLDALAQIQTVIDNYRDESNIDIGEVTITDTDDFQTTIEVGANPVGSCQHYEFGMYRVGLAGYFEPTVKIVTVSNQRGRYIARAAVRLAHDSEGNAAMVMEPVYTSQASDDIIGAVTDHVRAKAESMDVPLFVHDGSDAQGVSTTQGSVTIKRQRAPYMYSDVFGGIRLYDESKPQANTRRLSKIV